MGEVVILAYDVRTQQARARSQDGIQIPPRSAACEKSVPAPRPEAAKGVSLGDATAAPSRQDNEPCTFFSGTQDPREEDWLDIGGESEGPLWKNYVRLCLVQKAVRSGHGFRAPQCRAVR
jgi:hypothetical protein